MVKRVVKRKEREREREKGLLSIVETEESEQNVKWSRGKIQNTRVAIMTTQGRNKTI